MNPKEKTELLTLLEEQERQEAAEKIDCTNLSRADANLVYFDLLSDKEGNKAALKRLCKTDLFFLLVYGLKRPDADHDWLYARCREVQASPDGHLDLWAREHYKSTIITFAKSIQDILLDPNVTIGIFSHTKNIAKGFLSQIKTELQQNKFLKDLFPEILYQDPENESPQWSLDNGIKVKRTANPKEATIEAWGVVDNQPTSKHFTRLVYDDLVTLESVSTPEQIKKTITCLETSYNLGAKGGKRRFIGTRYHANDPYNTIMKRGTVKARIYKATDDGKLDGIPVFLDQETLLEKRRDFGPYTFSCQMLQNPVADKSMGFKEEWLKYYKTLGDTSRWNKYIFVDPASKKKKTSDYTVMLVMALAPDANYYLIDGIRDRLNLPGRARALFALHRKHKPKDTFYEEYGMQADKEHMEYVMEQESYRFNIEIVGGQVAKEDRILRLVPLFEQHRLWLPERLHFVDYEAKAQDLVNSFIEDEYKTFPVSTHDDILDCMARVVDSPVKFPKEEADHNKTQPHYASLSDGWME